VVYGREGKHFKYISRWSVRPLYVFRYDRTRYRRLLRTVKHLPFQTSHTTLYKAIGNGRTRSIRPLAIFSVTASSSYTFSFTDSQHVRPACDYDSFSTRPVKHTIPKTRLRVKYNDLSIVDRRSLSTRDIIIVFGCTARVRNPIFSRPYL